MDVGSEYQIKATNDYGVLNMCILSDDLGASRLAHEKMSHISLAVLKRMGITVNSATNKELEDLLAEKELL